MDQHSAIHPMQHPTGGGAAGPTAALAGMVAGLRLDGVDEFARRAARRHLIDTLGAMLAGADQPVTLIAERAELPPEVGGKSVAGVHLGRARGDLGRGEGLDLFAQCVGGFAQAEIQTRHRFLLRFAPPGRCCPSVPTRTPPRRCQSPRPGDAGVAVGAVWNAPDARAGPAAVPGATGRGAAARGAGAQPSMPGRGRQRPPPPRRGLLPTPPRRLLPTPPRRG